MPSWSNHSLFAEYCCASLPKSKLRALPSQRPTSASATRRANPAVDSRESGSIHVRIAPASGTTMRSVVSTG
jgi:hypothetical protein